MPPRGAEVNCAPKWGDNRSEDTPSTGSGMEAPVAYQKKGTTVSGHTWGEGAVVGALPWV